MRAYPVNLRKDGKFILATFPNLPEAITQGRTRAEALAAASDALESAIEFYLEDHRPVPTPPKLKRDQESVELQCQN